MTDESTAVENELRVLDELLREYGKKARPFYASRQYIASDEYKMYVRLYNETLAKRNALEKVLRRMRK